ncbi:hypothetical protein ACSBR2_042027 [Camellia fascicularis]
MGTVETSLSQGPVYFDVYPHLIIALEDANILDVLNVRILTKGYNFKPGTRPISLICRIYFKVLITNSPYVRKKSAIGETVLFETNMYASNISIPRKIKWNEIEFPQHWKLQQAVPPTPILHHDTEDVVQNRDGDIYLSFRKPRPQILGRSTSSTSIPRSLLRDLGSNLGGGRKMVALQSDLFRDLTLYSDQNLCSSVAYS